MKPVLRATTPEDRRAEARRYVRNDDVQERVSVARGCGRGNGQTADAVLLDGLRDEAALLGVFDELAQIRGARRTPLRRAGRLLHAAEAAVEHARAGQLLDIRHQHRAKPRHRVELLVDHAPERHVGAGRALERRALQIAAEIKVVRALRRDRDAASRAAPDTSTRSPHTPP